MNTEEICARVSFDQVLEALGLEHIRKGKMRCPNPEHVDTHPSVSVDRKKGRELYFCHVCGDGGNVIGLVRAAKACSVRAAMEWLGETFSLDVDLPKTRRPTRADYHSAIDRLMDSNQPPREEFTAIYTEHIGWLLHQIVVWERKHTDYGERIRALGQWEVRLLSAYRAQMRDKASTEAREAFEASGEDLSSIVKVPSDVWRYKHSTKGAAKW